MASRVPLKTDTLILLILPHLLAVLFTTLTSTVSPWLHLVMTVAVGVVPELSEESEWIPAVLLPPTTISNSILVPPSGRFCELKILEIKFESKVYVYEIKGVKKGFKIS